MSDSATAAYQYYRRKGIASIPAAGIASVLYAESGLNPGPQDNEATDHGGVLAPAAFGVASWNGNRQAALRAYADKHALDPRALNTQLDFVLAECADSYRSVWDLVQAGDRVGIGSFITVFVRQYENPKNPAAEIARAFATAQRILRTTA